ncbi:ATP-dependent DNA helicase DinG [Endozoicomonas ascidiicola]|uniref:ATP-dependent DNA helicase DinG n=1 Tax=Endozoicomonas ascidiicola TaxID=1698521 RepID=UPI00082B2B96|nr:ATP-dependent DNA helicase DinG [Endozoicomonas ascidiicola]
MLDEPQKKTIQKAYSAFLESKKLKARSGQKQMIAEIARALGDIKTDSEGNRISDPSVTVIEAGTGTGKTVGYVLPSVVMAQAAKKRLVIATATVTLQEQVINKDLPDIILKTGLKFSYTLAKGRGRYACLSKLDRLLQEEEATASLMDMFAYDGFTLESDQSSLALYQNMLEAFAASKWEGDRDSWPDALEDQQWRTITTDHAQCSGRRCGFFKNCPFYKARADLEHADVVVANHDLVLADLALGGGAILPEPKDAIYVFDEGHHLPDKAIGHFTCQTRVKGTATWLERAGRNLQKMLSQQALPGDLGELLERLQPEFDSLVNALGHTREMLHSIAHFEPRTQFTPQGESQVAHYRFPEGVIPEELRQQAERLKAGFSKCSGMLEKVASALNDAMDGDVPGIDRWQAEQLYPEIGGMLSRMEGHFQLWLTYTMKDPEGEPPSARWLKWSENSFGEELEVFSSPILSSRTLWQTLWNPAYAVIATSATLAALGSFSRFRMRSGVPAESKCVIVPSPFLHQEAASLVVPAMLSNPKNAEEHTAELVELLPDLLNETDHPRGLLVLFSSRRQMKDVHFGMDAALQDNILLQDDYSRQELLKKHRQNIDDGKVSILFGLASLAEGIDLPGHYCEHVIIAKIPFSVPDDPVESALSEWLEAQGRNPFMEITVPDAAIRLIQACGRLLRTEQDRGRITLMDRRLVTARYGQMILNSLPPFKRVIESGSIV